MVGHICDPSTAEAGGSEVPSELSQFVANMGYMRLRLKERGEGFGEMTQWLIALVALAEDLGLVHGIHMVIHKPNSSFRVSRSFSSLCRS